MLRSPTHVPTIQLTQIHQAQYDPERSPGTTSIYRKLYRRDHNYPNGLQCKQQQQQQQQQQQRTKKDHLKATTAALFTSTRITKASTTTKITPTDLNNDVISNPKTKTTLTSATLKTKATLNSNTSRTTSSATPAVVALTNAISASSSQQSNANNFTKTSTPPPSLTTTTTTTTATATTTGKTITAAATTTITPTSSPSSIHNASMSPTSQTPTRTSSLFDSCHRKIRLIGGGPVAFLGGLVAKARRKERDGDQNSTDTKLYLEESVLERKLPEADLKALVDLPAGLDYNEWLASHTLALFEHVNLVYGTVSEFCTPSGCSDMTGPGNRTYLWFDEKGKKTRVAAPQYIDYVMTFTQKTVSDESIFPTKYANEFPGSFESIARKILRLQFHVIAHLYAAHFREIALLGLHTHLNLTFAHLTALHRRFNLIDEKETDVLRDLEVALRLTDDNNINNSSHHVQQSASHSSVDHSSSSSTYDGVASATIQTTPSPASFTAGGNATGNGGQQHVATSLHHQEDGTATLLGGHQLVDGSQVGGRSHAPICTQPEAKSGVGGGVGGIGANNVFGGGGGLMGGILGDFTGSDFSDTSRYCTSAVPPSSFSNNSSHAAAAANASSTNGAGALHLNFTSNFAHQHHHHHHHHHHAHHQAQHQQNLGLLQCNANATAPSPHSTTTA